MAVIVHDCKPKALLKAIKSAIDKGDVDTWEYDAGGDFTHTPKQWYERGWLRPHVMAGELHFGLIGQQDVPMEDVIYGIYHGRFIEMLLTHFDEDFTTACASALPTDIDLFD